MYVEEINLKIKNLKNLMLEKNFDGILVSRQTNFLWLTGGKRNNVIKNDDVSSVYLFITRKCDARYLIASASDARRVFEEELDGLEK